MAEFSQQNEKNPGSDAAATLWRAGSGSAWTVRPAAAAFWPRGQVAAPIFALRSPRPTIYDEVNLIEFSRECFRFYFCLIWALFHKNTNH